MKPVIVLLSEMMQLSDAAAEEAELSDADHAEMFRRMADVVMLVDIITNIKTDLLFELSEMAARDPLHLNDSHCAELKRLVKAIEALAAL